MDAETTRPGGLDNKKLFLLAVALGFVIFLIPLKFGPGRDPFDALFSYEVWMGGAFLSSIALCLYRSKGAWNRAVGVAAGFPSAVLFDMVFGSRDYNLFPLTMTFGFIVGLIPAYLGAAFGKLVRVFVRVPE